MASVRLTIGEAVNGPLPETCMKCGQPAAHWVKKKFAWHPSWVLVLLLGGVLPFVIVAAILTKRATLIAPMCPAHRWHWTTRTAAILLGLLVLFGLLIALIAVSDGPPRARSNWPSILGFALAASGIVWLIATGVLIATSIRPRQITDVDLVLQNVSDKFIDDFERDLDDDNGYDAPPPRAQRQTRDDGHFRRG
jgi:hypothetical protein